MSQVIHQPHQHRFVINFEENEAVLDYAMLSETRIDFTHTFVPTTLRGKGFAEQLVRAGLAWAKEQEYEILASCWYVQKFLA
jgi:uncharacterized protein